MKAAPVKIAAAIITLFCIAVNVVLHFDWRLGDSSWELERSVGKFDTRDEAVAASLRRLSRAIRQHPTTRNYRIHFELRVRDRQGGGGATLYDRQLKTIGFKSDPGSGFALCWTNVDGAAIHAVAATNGTFAGFGSEVSSRITNIP